MKKLFITLVLCIFSQALVSQDLIKPINGKSFFAEIQSVENGIVNYQIGVSKMTMPTTDIALIEFSEGGVQYFHEEALKQVDPNNIEAPVYKRGHKVYIPFSSKDVTQRSGALKLRELVSNGNVWEVADCKEEAHFILEFEYSEIGADGAVVNIKDRKGNQLVQTPKVKNSGWDPVQKGEEIAKAQYEKYVSKIGTGELTFDNGRLNLSGRRKALVIRPEIMSGYGAQHFPIDANVTISYQFSPYFSIGLGSGINLAHRTLPQCNLIAIPVYANLRVYFCDKPWSPFFDVKAGYNLPLNTFYNDHYYDDFYDLYKLYSLKLSNANMRATLGLEVNHFNFGFTAGMNRFYRVDHTDYDEDYAHIESRFVLSLSVAYNFQIWKK